MRIFFGVAVSVVHAVHDGVSTRIEKRGTLSYKGKEVKETIPEPVHGEHFMRRIPMQEKCLTEE